jgi:hypothetical protein
METTVKREPVKRLPKPNNIVTVPTSLSTDFFKWWCIFLKPFINLTSRETEVIACLLKHRWELSKYISDPAILDTMVMGDDTRKKVLDECNITLKHYNVLISNLRKNKVISNNIINPRLIPNVREDDNGCFQLLILFKDDSVK